MNAQLPPVLAAALAPFAPPSSVVHQIVEASRLQADLHNNALKASGALDDRRHAAALTAQIERPWMGVRP